MTRDETKRLLQIMKSLYPNWKPNDISLAVDAWASVLDEEEAETMAKALKLFAKGDESGFAPAPGQLIALKKRVEWADFEAKLMAKQYWMLPDGEKPMIGGS